MMQGERLMALKSTFDVFCSLCSDLACFMDDVFWPAAASVLTLLRRHLQ